MKKYVLLMALTVTLTQVHAQTDWSRAWTRLWRNADQRGEALLQSGDAAGAAKEYSDTQRKGYASLKAGDYVDAAQTLRTVDTTEAHYNRGNALAHAGDLQGALQAYDAALKRDPQHQDARHNRDVVAQALQAQQQKKDAKTAASPKDGQQGKSQDSKSGESQAEQKSSAKEGHADKPSQRISGASDKTLDAAAQGTQTSAAGPMTEKQIAQEQWLRSIPDDPGGLLRRKFLIEHMRRHQGKEP